MQNSLAFVILICGVFAGFLIGYDKSRKQHAQYFEDLERKYKWILEWYARGAIQDELLELNKSVYTEVEIDHVIDLKSRHESK